MYQYDDPTAVASMPIPAEAGTAGFFTDGSPAGGVPATILRADFMNSVMMELLNVIEAAGITPSKTVNSQLLAAIQTLFQGNTPGRLLRITPYTGGVFTWTKGAGTTALRVRVQACGAPGGGSPATGSGQASIGSGGSAGSYAEAWITGASVPASATVTAPVGPNGVSGASGTNGSSASFGSLVTAPGGNGGTTAGPSAPPFPPTSVTITSPPSGANVVGTPGASGGYAFAIATTCIAAGQGGNATIGAGAPAVSVGANGAPAAGYGGGGGGTAQGPSAGALTGGKGGDAIVIVEEYGSI
ncbi:hypothetical protein [Burkholderia vietnamiensis]|uniref:hypothetical protein n=1 Tax=Burkholderia vietnamiensis TaxID=60552 RepID=UPI001CF38EB4|nr:hypothetical protein [Burkholderia vietnamiensis]MCA8195487.1 hypothetical protein [Burkholderia vietnamiensis]